MTTSLIRCFVGSTVNEPLYKVGKGFHFQRTKQRRRASRSIHTQGPKPLPAAPTHTDVSEVSWTRTGWGEAEKASPGAQLRQQQHECGSRKRRKCKMASGLS